MYKSLQNIDLDPENATNERSQPVFPNPHDEGAACVNAVTV